MLQILYLPHSPGPRNPTSPHIIPTTMLCPLSLTSPTAAIASFTGTQVKLFFFISFFHSFSDQCYNSLYPTCQVLIPLPLHHIIPTPVLCPSSLASPATAIACIHRHASKDKFFFSCFRFFSDQCYRDHLYPTCQVLNPLSLHHIIPTPMPHPQ